jgi:hypothetical protein
MKSYTIKKGKHYSSAGLFERIGSIGSRVNRLAVTFRFSAECWWAPPRNSDDHDLNKLCGIGYGLNHHKNSVRLAWVPDFDNPGKIQIYGYIYDELPGDNHLSQYIMTVQTGTIYTGVITNTGDRYDFLLGGAAVSMPNTHKDPGLSFRLFPYFGGNNTAPQDMVIELDMIPS